MPSLTTTTTIVKTVELKPALKRKLLTELRAYGELKAQAKAIEQALEGHKEAISALQAETGEASLSIEGFTVTLVSPVRSTLDKKLLLLNGVSMGQIEQSTITKPTKPYTKVTTPDGGE